MLSVKFHDFVKVQQHWIAVLSSRFLISIKGKIKLGIFLSCFDAFNVQGRSESDCGRDLKDRNSFAVSF